MSETPDPLRNGARYDTYVICNRMISLSEAVILDVDLESGAIRTFTPEELAQGLDMVWATSQPQAAPKPQRKPSAKLERLKKG